MTLEMKELEAAVEGILFASGEPVHIDRICLALDIDRLAAEQHEGAGHEPSAQHAVHLPVSQVDAAVFAFVDVGDSLRTGFGQVGDSRRSAAAFTGDHLFGECVPFPAGGAASQPFGGFEAAVAAEECFLDLCHVVSFFRGVPMLPRRASAFLVIIPFPRRSESR